MVRPIRVLGTGAFLPGEPVPPERVEDVLGRIPGLPPRFAARAERIGVEVLARGGVRARHYALDPVTRAQTETNVSMMEKAVRAALAPAAIEPGSVDLLITAAPMSDYACPSTSALLQGRLGVESLTEIEIHSNCTGAPKGVQIALDMLRVGRHRRAVVVYSQLSSAFLRAEFFNPAKVGLEHLALRWMMSDGAGAIVLDGGETADEGPHVLDAYVESTGGLREPGMIGGSAGAFAHEVPLEGRPTFEAIHASGRHHVAQDLTSVGRDAPHQLVEGVARMLERVGVAGADVSRFLLGIPGRRFMTDDVKAFFRRRVGADPDLAPFDIEDFGYCGGATIFVQLDRLLRGPGLRSGELVAAYLEESSKWMSGGFVVRG